MTSPGRSRAWTTFVNMVMRNPAGANETERHGRGHRQQLRGQHRRASTSSCGPRSSRASRPASTSAPGACTTSAAARTGGSCGSRPRRRWPWTPARVYGFTKGLGERICQYFAEHFGMRLIALRITGPRTREAFLAERACPSTRSCTSWTRRTSRTPSCPPSRSSRSGRGRFDAVLIAADEHEVDHNLTKARMVLGWAPQGQRCSTTDRPSILRRGESAAARTQRRTPGEHRSPGVRT